ncbi:MAG TPA: hypothetical protein VMZ53_15690 [Kofleriaceae bacterium]|nr:hypothetical protein [Kofleriaceae bacterium]
MRAAVEAAWQRVVESWDDQTRHDAFIGLVAQYGDFAWAASKYKERAGDAIADKHLEKIRKAATATMFATASKKPEGGAPYKSTMVIFAVLILMMLIALIGVKLMHDTRPHPEPPPPPTTPARH